MTDELCAEFTRATQLRVYNPTLFDLFIGDGGGVFSSQQIYKYTFIGELHGTPEYLSNVTHNDYLILDDVFVLDVSINVATTSQRSILTWIRNECETDSPCNCIIRTEVNESTCESKFTLWSTERIDEGDELVYAIHLRA